MNFEEWLDTQVSYSACPGVGSPEYELAEKAWNAALSEMQGFIKAGMKAEKTVRDLGVFLIGEAQLLKHYS